MISEAWLGNHLKCSRMNRWFTRFSSAPSASLHTLWQLVWSFPAWTMLWIWFIGCYTFLKNHRRSETTLFSSIAFIHEWNYPRLHATQSLVPKFRQSSLYTAARHCKDQQLVPQWCHQFMIDSGGTSIGFVCQANPTWFSSIAVTAITALTSHRGCEPAHRSLTYIWH